MIRRFLFLSLAALSALASAYAADAISPKLEGDMATDPVTKELVFTANPRLVYGNTVLRADEIRYDRQTKIVTARGHVELTRGPRRLLAEEIVYRMDTEIFTVKRIRLGEFPLYVSGASAEGTLKEIAVTDATIFYREPAFLTPSLSARKIVYQPDLRVRAESVRIGVGDIRPITLLTHEQKLNEPILSYLDGHAGYRGDLGLYVGVGAYAPFLPGVQAGGDIHYFTKRGFLVGPAGTYQIENGESSVSGSLQSGYIHDNGKKLTDILGRAVPEDRGYIDWTHTQRIGEHLTIHGQAHYWSDSEVIRDFIPEDFYSVQQPDSFLEGAYTGKNYVVSLFARAQPNAYYRVQQRLPELRFDLLPTPIGHGIYERFESSIAVLREHPVLPGDNSIRSERFDAYYGLERPIVPNSWFTFNPVAGARLTHYARASGGRNDYTRVLGEFGFDTALRASGVYGYKNERWQIDGIRHLLTPRLSYRYIPKADKGRAYIPAIDDEVFNTYLQPLGLGDRRTIDDLKATNVVRIGWDNTFQTRDKTYGSRDLLRVDFATDFDLDPPPGGHDFSAIHTELAFTPVNWLQFDLYESFTPHNLTLQELNTGLVIHDGDVWSLRFSNHYLRRQIQEYIGEGRYRLNEVYQTYLRLHYDARKSRFVEQSFGVVQNVSNLWTVRYGVSIFNGPRRESSFGFKIEVRLAGF